MDKNKQTSKSIQDKLTTIKYNCNEEGHLKPDKSRCENCKEKTCTFICPAEVYQFDSNKNELVVQYENCLECGACRIACPYNAIDWSYPKAGYGVIFKNS